MISDDDNELDRNDNTKESIKSSDRKPILCDDDLTAFVLQELKNAINSRKIANKAHLAFLIYSLICSFEIRSRLVCVLPIYPFTSLEKPTKSAQEMIYIEFLIGEDWSVIDSDMQQVLKEVPSIKAPYIFAFENGTRLLNCQLCLTFLFLFCFSKNNKKKKGSCFDISPKYSSNWQNPTQKRLAEEWIQNTLQPYTQNVSKEEISEIEAMKKIEEFPLTIEGFKRHPL